MQIYQASIIQLTERLALSEAEISRSADLQRVILLTPVPSTPLSHLDT